MACPGKWKHRVNGTQAQKTGILSAGKWKSMGNQNLRLEPPLRSFNFEPHPFHEAPSIGSLRGENVTEPMRGTKPGMSKGRRHSGVKQILPSKQNHFAFDRTIAMVGSLQRKITSVVHIPFITFQRFHWIPTLSGEPPKLVSQFGGVPPGPVFPVSLPQEDPSQVQSATLEVPWGGWGRTGPWRPCRPRL